MCGYARLSERTYVQESRQADLCKRAFALKYWSVFFGIQWSRLDDLPHVYLTPLRPAVTS